MITPEIWGVIALPLGFIVGAVIVWLISGLLSQRHSEQIRIQLAGTQAELKVKSEKLTEVEQSHARMTEDNSQLQVQVAQLQKERESDIEKIRWIEQAQSQMREAFEALASQSLQKNSTDFLTRSRQLFEAVVNQTRSDWATQKAEMKGLVDPLQQNLQSIDGYVRELEQKREGAYQGVSEQIRQLVQTHTDLKNTTVTLTQALKSSTIRGRWGEMQLRRVAELSGMEKHISFREQAVTEDGRPDMIVFLPNGGVIPIDSKAPMEAYLEAVAITEDTARQIKMNEHVKAIQARVRELGQKRYWDQFEKSPDFVVMFMPSEACLSAAFETEPQLMEYAITHKVIITTPVTFLALLRAVAYGWQQHQVTENARKIAEEAAEFYNRLKIFVGHISELGEDLGKTVKEYNQVVGSFEHRLLPSARRLEALGVAVTELPTPAAVDLTPRLIEGDHGAAS